MSSTKNALEVCRARREELKRELAQARMNRDQNSVNRIADALGELDEREWAAMSDAERAAFHKGEPSE